MKRKFTGIVFSAVLTVISFVFLCSSTAFANAIATENKTALPAVTLGTSKGVPVFSINRESNDLFDNFKGVMPGQILQQNVIIRSDADGISGGNTFDIYMYARNIDDSELQKELFRQVGIKVYKGSQELNVLEVQSGDKGVYLGRFSKGSEVELLVEMQVPLTLGNEYQNAKGIVEWTFYAKQYVETPEPPNTPDVPDTPDEPVIIDVPDDPVALAEGTGTPPVPHTGVSENVMLYGILMGVSASVLIIMIISGLYRKKKA